MAKAFSTPETLRLIASGDFEPMPWVLREAASQIEEMRQTLERVRLAGRAIVLQSVQKSTIIHDAGIMQDDAVKLAEALRGTLMDEDHETEASLYVEVGFLTAEEA